MRAFVFALVLGMLVSACGDDDATGPIIEDIAPASAAPGTAIEVLGDRFCGDSDDDANGDGTCVENVIALVNFGEEASVMRGNVQAYEHTRISVTVPAQAPTGATVVVVIRGGVPSNAFDFDVQ